MTLLPSQSPIPSLQDLFNCNPVNPSATCAPTPIPGLQTQHFANLGDLVSGILNVSFTIAFFLSFIWMFWGAFEYIFAGGDKEKLAQAKSRIISALIGLAILILAFAIAQYAEKILGPRQFSPISLVQSSAYAYVPTPFPCGSGSPGSVSCPPTIDISQQYGFGNVSTLGEGLNHLVAPAFALAVVAVIVYSIIGAFTYLISAGNKEAVSKAQQMIAHSVIGFIILILLFFVMQYLPQFFGIKFSLF